MSLVNRILFWLRDKYASVTCVDKLSFGNAIITTGVVDYSVYYVKIGTVDDVVVFHFCSKAVPFRGVLDGMARDAHTLLTVHGIRKCHVHIFFAFGSALLTMDLDKGTVTGQIN